MTSGVAEEAKYLITASNRFL